MENRIVIPNRGILEIKDSNIKCFLGKDNNCKSSEQLWNELKVQEPIVSQETYKLGEEEYIIYYPIQEKQISVVTKNGKSYNSTIYFIDDIKNIISGLKMINPCYIFKGEYKPLNSEMYYFHFLYLEEENEIKDVDINSIKFDELENTYKSIEIKKTQILGEINKNIFVYSKIDDIDKENYYITLSRTRLSSELKMFYESKERDRVSDLIFGMYGNYASGKSFFLIYFNYFCKYPSVYLNLKALKKAFKTEGFQDILNNELMFLFYKLKKSFNDFKNFVSKFIPFDKKIFENLIISIINELSNEPVLIIIDQYQEDNYPNFITNLKRILYSDNSKIKVILASSMNDGPIREAYLDIILNRIKPKTENEDKIKEEEKKIKGFKTEIAEEQKKKEEEMKKGEKKEIEEKEKEEERMEEEGMEDQEMEEEEKRKKEQKMKEEEQKKKIEEIKEKEEENEKKIINNYIPYTFVKRLVNTTQIKENIKKIKLENNKEFNDNLELFDFLPLYYSLCKRNKKNLNDFVEKTKGKIREKILKFNHGEKFNISYFDEIRKLIDNEITADELKTYSKYIPFKYFYIEQEGQKLILRTHFPLVREVWEKIVMDKTADLISGNFQYDGNVIGSILELNIISNIKNKNISLDIDCFIKVDSIYNFGTIVEKDTNNFENKDIFITQKNQNGPYFDIAFIKGKQVEAPILTFIQVKKGMTNNRIDKKQMYDKFEEKKKNFLNLFKFIPENKNINLIYISFINKEIQQIIKSHDKYKNDRSKKVSSLGKEITSKYYSFSQLNKFCVNNDIQIYYYDLEKHVFFVKDKENFIQTELNLSNKNQIKYLKYIYDTKCLDDQLISNMENSKDINKNYKSYLQKKRKEPPFTYKIDDIDLGMVIKFAESYFENITILHYIDLRKAHIDIEYENLSKNQAIICLKKDKRNKFTIDSFIYQDYLISCKGENLEFGNNVKLGGDNDFLVAINFDTISESLKLLLNKNN